MSRSVKWPVGIQLKALNYSRSLTSALFYQVAWCRRLSCMHIQRPGLQKPEQGVYRNVACVYASEISCASLLAVRCAVYVSATVNRRLFNNAARFPTEYAIIPAGTAKSFAFLG